MTGQALAVREPERLDVEQLKYIAGTNFVPDHYRGKLPEIMACIATGRELGLGDMESLRQIYVVNGRPTMSAELMVKLARRAGHSISGEVSDKKAVVRGKRADTGDEMAVTFTIEEAGAAGLTSKPVWKQWPKSMLWARASSQLCRMLFPDCLSGVRYTPEEAEVTPYEEAVEGPRFTPPDGDPGPGALSESDGDVDPPSDATPAEDPGPEDEGQSQFAMPEGAKKTKKPDPESGE